MEEAGKGGKRTGGGRTLPGHEPAPPRPPGFRRTAPHRSFFLSGGYPPLYQIKDCLHRPGSHCHLGTIWDHRVAPTQENSDITLPRPCKGPGPVPDSKTPDRHPPVGAKASGISPGGKARVSSVVGLSLLEVIRTLDLPTEVLASEDPTRTMPRRLGLSDVVDQQIRIFREQVRRRERITDRQAQDLFHLVLRRPDSEEAFLNAGELLAGRTKPLAGVRRLYPEKALYSLARRKTRRQIQSLFGRPIGGFSHGPFTLEARGHFLLEMDPGGDACALLTGLSQAILGRCLRRPLRVRHTACEARKHDLCRWVVSES
jgi:hypothetical protein